MIDEEKLIDELLNNYLVKNNGTWNDAIDRALELTKSSQKLNEWIPCSERLPENYETVNITYVNRNPESYYEHVKDKPFTGTAIFHYGKWYWYSCVCEDYLKDCGDSMCDRMYKDIEVLAWQPLPEPYDMRNEVTE